MGVLTVPRSRSAPCRLNETSPSASKYHFSSLPLTRHGSEPNRLNQRNTFVCGLSTEMCNASKNIEISRKVSQVQRQSRRSHFLIEQGKRNENCSPMLTASVSGRNYSIPDFRSSEHNISFNMCTCVSTNIKNGPLCVKYSDDYPCVSKDLSSPMRKCYHNKRKLKRLMQNSENGVNISEKVVRRIHKINYKEDNISEFKCNCTDKKKFKRDPVKHSEFPESCNGMFSRIDNSAAAKRNGCYRIYRKIVLHSKHMYKTKKKSLDICSEGINYNFPKTETSAVINNSECLCQGFKREFSAWSEKHSPVKQTSKDHYYQFSESSVFDDGNECLTDLSKRLQSVTLCCDRQVNNPQDADEDEIMLVKPSGDTGQLASCFSIPDAVDGICGASVNHSFSTSDKLMKKFLRNQLKFKRVESAGVTDISEEMLRKLQNNQFEHDDTPDYLSQCSNIVKLCAHKLGMIEEKKRLIRRGILIDGSRKSRGEIAATLSPLIKHKQELIAEDNDEFSKHIRRKPVREVSHLWHSLLYHTLINNTQKKLISDYNSVNFKHNKDIAEASKVLANADSPQTTLSMQYLYNIAQEKLIVSVPGKSVCRKSVPIRSTQKSIRPGGKINPLKTIHDSSSDGKETQNMFVKRRRIHVKNVSLHRFAVLKNFMQSLVEKSKGEIKIRDIHKKKRKRVRKISKTKNIQGKRPAGQNDLAGALTMLMLKNRNPDESHSKKWKMMKMDENNKRTQKPLERYNLQEPPPKRFKLSTELKENNPSNIGSKCCTAVSVDCEKFNTVNNVCLSLPAIVDLALATHKSLSSTENGNHLSVDNSVFPDKDISILQDVPDPPGYQEPITVQDILDENLFLEDCYFSKSTPSTYYLESDHNYCRNAPVPTYNNYYDCSHAVTNSLYQPDVESSEKPQQLCETRNMFDESLMMSTKITDIIIPHFIESEINGHDLQQSSHLPSDIICTDDRRSSLYLSPPKKKSVFVLGSMFEFCKSELEKLDGLPNQVGITLDSLPTNCYSMK